MSEQSPQIDSEDRFVLQNRADGTNSPVEGAIEIGRGTECELVLDSMNCSRVHAQMDIADGALWVEDRNSTNGTFVNERQISERTRLQHDDVVQFGDVRFRVIAPSRPEPEDDGEKTFVASRESLQRILGQDEETGSAAGKEPIASSASESRQGGDSAGPRTSAAAPKSGEPARPAESNTAGREPCSSDNQRSEPPDSPASESRQDRGERGGRDSAGAPETGDSGGAEATVEPNEHEAAAAASGSGVDPSIPRSWADAEQLEQASYTSLVAGGTGETWERDSRVLNPSKAVAQVRLQIPEELAILIGLTEPVLGTLFELPAEGTEKWEIGRGEGADIKIDADSVSGRHAQLIHENGRWKIVNMMSVNGTFVNERKVLSAYLKGGDVIRMGGVKLVFDARVEKSVSSPQADKPSTGAISRAGQLLTALFRWVTRQWSRLRGRS